MKKTEKFVLVLTSGGIDSTACVNFYKKMKFHVEGIFFDYGQASNKKEHAAVEAIGKYYKIPIKKITLTNNIKYQDGLIPGRNAFLYFGALMNFNNKNGIISSGIHSGTPYYDCSKKFLTEIQAIVDQYCQGVIKIEAPFLSFNKKEIWDYCLLEKVPLELTYSCELGKKQPCGKCSTCKDLQKLYASKK